MTRYPYNARGNEAGISGDSSPWYTRHSAFSVFPSVHNSNCASNEEKKMQGNKQKGSTADYWIDEHPIEE